MSVPFTTSAEPRIRQLNIHRKTPTQMLYLVSSPGTSFRISRIYTPRTTTSPRSRTTTQTCYRRLSGNCPHLRTRRKADRAAGKMMKRKSSPPGGGSWRMWERRTFPCLEADEPDGRQSEREGGTRRLRWRTTMTMTISMESTVNWLVQTDRPDQGVGRGGKPRSKSQRSATT